VENAELARRVGKLEQDMWFGNGKPGITTRVLILEDAMKSIQFYGRWILVTVAGILIAAIINLVIKR